MESMTTLPPPVVDLPVRDETSPARLVVAGGCFWCVEAVFLRVAGVTGARSGYAGGTAATANYQAVCAGITSHAEVVEITYDPAVVTLGTLLQVFFGAAHDPTQLNRQGNDWGRQYRSAIFYGSDAQRDVAARYMSQLEAAGVFSSPIVTTLEPLDHFYPAEDYHQNYAARNPANPYILFVSQPKVDGLEEAYGHLLVRPAGRR
jgi:peptide-methionine (S)-S-oxide reductase